MAELTHSQRVERMVFASRFAHSKSRAVNQLKSVPRKAAKGNDGRS